ncbi:TrmH family RNA methyltransferase [Falsibacillus albus]|uniref:RNA methyltransferase n=1 Tax=Falsibacillus albus TaxID=2478915 RepID=A0A3L7K6W0_9BACI|nr:RNA methyltransferase [Falsibacillus albus]RLQ97994.1 RNA methyltransferase [Falsibacillus albus]
MNFIQSPKNPQIKQWKKLTAKKERTKTGQYLIEGFHLVEEALKQDGHVMELIATENIQIPASWDLNNISLTYISEDASRAISETEAAQGIYAVCLQPKMEIDMKDVKTALFLDAVQDPGNVGTMIRTADAAGIDLVVLGEGSADLFNSKVIRSAQGSHFHLPIGRGDLNDWITSFEKHGIPIFGTALENGVPYKEADSGDAFALIVGNEGSGVASELLQRTKQNLFIPIYGKSESLNVAVAAGILMYYLKG